jgi:hypothetical protein
VALFEERFEVWTAADFDAYAEPKWKSNRFSLERTRVRTRAISLVEQALVRSGMPAHGVELWTSRHDPALVNAHSVSRQLVVLTRPLRVREELEARDPGLSASEPDRFHAYLGLEIHHQGIVFRLCIPEGARIGRQVLGAQVAAWRALTSDHALLLVGQPVTAEVLEIPGQVLGDLRLEQTFAREAAIEGGAGIDDLALWLTRTLPMLQALLEVDALEAPEPSVDATPAAPLPAVPLPAEVPAEPQTEAHDASPVTEVRATNHASEEPHRRAGAYRPAGAPPRRATLPAQERPPVDRIVPPTWKPEETALGRQMHQAEQRPMPRPQQGFRPDGPRHDGPRHDGPRHDGPRGPRPYEVAPEPKKAAPVNTILGPGARVKLTTGLFAGKFGTVQSIRGEDVQVMLGLMAVKVGKADVQLA